MFAGFILFILVSGRPYGSNILTSEKECLEKGKELMSRNAADIAECNKPVSTGTITIRNVCNYHVIEGYYCQEFKK